MSTPATGGEREIIAKGASVAATRVALIAASLVSSVVVARALPVGDRGRFGLLMATASLGIQFGNFGLPVANTYLVAKRPEVADGVVANTTRFIVVVAAALAILAPLLVAFVPALHPLRGAAAFGAWLVATTGLVQLLAQNILLGQFKFTVSNWVDLVARIGGIVAMVALWVLGLQTAATFGIAAALFSGVAAFWGIKRGLIRIRAKHWDRSLARDQVRLGARAYVACVASFALGRLPLYAIASRVGVSGAAYYTQALVVVDTMLVLPAALGTVLFPSLAASSDSKARIRATVRLAAAMVLFMLVSAAGAAWAGPWVLPLVYGRAYAASTPYLMALLPGAVALGVCSVTQNALSANGYPWSSVAAPVIGLVTVGGILALTTSPIACGWAYSIGGILMLVCSAIAWWLHRHQGHVDTVPNVSGDLSSEHAL